MAAFDNSNNSQGALKSETFVFQKLPKNTEELKAMSESDLSTPFKAAALTVAVLCNFKSFRDYTIEMLDFLKGSETLSMSEIQTLKDHLTGKDYFGYSFFEGATPENGYTPTEPYTVTVSETQFSYNIDGYAQLIIKSAGANRPAFIRLKKDGDKWYLYENFLLINIRPPKGTSKDPWM